MELMRGQVQALWTSCIIGQVTLRHSLPDLH